MSNDIYGNNLERGHCEVHPHVHEEYPCSICYSESQQEEHDKAQREDYEKEQRDDYEKQQRPTPPVEAKPVAIVYHIEGKLGKGNQVVLIDDEVRDYMEDDPDNKILSKTFLYPAEALAELDEENFELKAGMALYEKALDDKDKEIAELREALGKILDVFDNYLTIENSPVTDDDMVDRAYYKVVESRSIVTNALKGGE